MFFEELLPHRNGEIKFSHHFELEVHDFSRVVEQEERVLEKDAPEVIFVETPTFVLPVEVNQFHSPHEENFSHFLQQFSYLFLGKHSALPFHEEDHRFSEAFG